MVVPVVSSINAEWCYFELFLSLLQCVVFCTLMVILSTFVKIEEQCVGFPSTNPAQEIKPNTSMPEGYCFINGTSQKDSSNGSYYTGISSETFKENLNCKLLIRLLLKCSRYFNTSAFHNGRFKKIRKYGKLCYKNLFVHFTSRHC